MEQTECECPCECAIERDVCKAAEFTVTSDEAITRTCDVYSDIDILHQLPDDVSEKVAQCVEPECDKFSTEL